jgi:glyoxylase-like metal-dependent hydrolase (beta-lactamase superfamily II)
MASRGGRLTLFDVSQFGEPGAGCAYLLESRRNALIETGTAANAPRLLHALQATRLDFVFVTHVHLDHAGAAGHVAAAHPEATVVVHPRGLPHLAEPGRLAAGVRAASPSLAPLYGEPVPVDPRRLVACGDGETFTLGRDCHLTVVETPGHAPHHICLHQPESELLFVGDAVGHHDAPVGLPLTVPPRFDVEASRKSIRKLLDFRPRTLAFTHFGLTDDADRLLRSYPDAVAAWLARAAELRAAVGDDALADVLLAEPRHAGLSEIARELVRLCVRGALLTLDHDTAGSR